MLEHVARPLEHLFVILTQFVLKFLSIKNKLPNFDRKFTNHPKQHPPNMAETQSNIRERQDLKLQEPRKYNVLLHNDDFTTMEFVVRILKTVFRKTEAESQALMLRVHHEGKAVAGTYSLDIAQSKVQKATAIARSEGFPLRLSIEQDN